MDIKFNPNIYGVEQINADNVDKRILKEINGYYTKMLILWKILLRY
jgi:hypothetical protein